MKKRNIILDIITVVCIASVLLIPVSSLRVEYEYIKYDIFEYLRMIFIILSSILFLTNTRKTVFAYITSLICIIIFLLKIIVYNEIDIGMLYMLSGIVTVEHIVCNGINIKLVKKIFNISFYGYIIQLIIYSINSYRLTGVFEVISSVYDPNYTGYFTFCLGIYFYYIKDKLKSTILLILGLFTYSRLYIIALIIFITVQKFERITKNTKKIVYGFKFYIIIQILVIIVSLIYSNLYETVRPEYVYLEGFNRMTNFLDESNYIRCQANLFAVESISFNNILVGLKDGTFKGINYFSNKTIFPHNLLWSMFVHYGMVMTIMYLSRYTKVFKKYNLNIIPFYFVLMLYHSILGLGPFYGVDLVIIALIVIVIYKENKYV